MARASRVPKKQPTSKDAAIRILRRDLASERLAHRQALEQVEALRYRVPSPYEWRTGEGISIRPSSMDEPHLRNAISYVQRRLVAECGRVPWLGSVKKWAQALYEFLQEAERRGIKV